MSKVNPNPDKDYIDKIDLSNTHNFPKFLKSIEFNPFRHIPNLKVDFLHPISVIAGTNRSGKSTILMALACSHLKFEKQDIVTGKIRRHTWSDLMLFTNHDKQKEDWIYYITYKIGDIQQTLKGYRKCTTGKWGGIGKKEGQVKDKHVKERQVVFIDMDRILPARNFGKTIHREAKKGVSSSISNNNEKRINEYISYVLEENFTINNIAHSSNKYIYKYANTNEYSSYNAASGEDVLSKIIINLVEAEEGSLVLIDEIEIGLHPKVQRRLMQVIYSIAKNDNKQFIITTHSPSILSSVPDKARIFIEKDSKGKFKAIPNISINEALSKMDSESYPLVDLFCEDGIASYIIKKAISEIQKLGHQNFSNLINIIEVGDDNKTYSRFQFHKPIEKDKDKDIDKKIKIGYACVLDGDMRNKYSKEENLHFLYSNSSPEKFLVDEYEKSNNDRTLRYHIDSSDNHCLFDKMNELSIGTTKEDALEICWNHFINTDKGKIYFEELQSFIKDTVKRFSPNL